MTTSVFTELLSSYSGLRKRTWSPQVIEEGPKGSYAQMFGPGGWKQQNIVGAEYKAILQQMLTQVQKAAQAGQSGQSITQDQVAVAQQQMQAGQVLPGVGGGILVRGPKDATNFGKEKIPKVIEAINFYLKNTDEEEDTDNEKANDDKINKGVEDEAQAQEDEEVAAADKKAENAAALEKAEEVKVTEPQKKSLFAMWKKQGLSEEESEAELARLEKTINTPHKGTKIYKGLVETQGARPDLPAKVKQQALNAVCALASATNKIVTVTLADGTRVQTLYESDLTEEEIQALATTTIRGEGGSGGVYVGKGDMERQSNFSDLQEFTSDYDHSKYGSTFGKALGENLSPLWGVRILPIGVDAADISDKEDFDDVARHSTRQSNTVESRGSGAQSLSNDWKGKLTEDIFELNVAVLAGDKEAQGEAIKQLRKRLEAGAEFTKADLDNLESVLLGDEYDGLLDFQRLEALGVPANIFVRQAILQAAVQTEVFFAKVGISKENVETVERPSNASLQGYKSDIDIVLKPGTKVNAEWEDCVREDEHGRLVLSISIKNYNQLRGPTVLGSSSLNKSYGTVKPGDIEAAEHRRTADRLHGEHLDRAVEGGHMSEDDRASCIAAREHDRVLRAGLEEKFGGLTDPNLASLRSFMQTMLSPANEMQFDTIAEKTAYEKQLNEINDYLKSGNKGDAQMAAVKIWQLHRQARAQKDPEYAKAVAFNDAVFSAGTFDNEVIMRGSPGKVTLGKYHDIFNNAASALFGPGGSAVIRSGASQIMDSQGNIILDTRITAKLTGGGSRKLMGECKMADEGRRQSTTTENAHVKESKTPLAEAVDQALGTDPDEEEEEEVLTGSTLYPILQNLPPKETGDIQRVGDKLIVTHLPFCLKVKHNGYEFEGGFPSKGKALKALDLIRLIAKEQDETIDAKVEDYDAGRTLS